MEAVEIFVYVGVAIILGGLIIGFIAGWDVEDAYDGFKRMFSREQEIARYERVTSAEIPGRVLSLWESCGFGTVQENATFYITDDALVGKEQLFAVIRAGSLCDSLQSAELSCGEREDVVFPEIQAPAVIRATCDTSSRQLIVTG